MELAPDEIVPLSAVADGVAGVRILIVNVFALRSDRSWILVDAALQQSLDESARRVPVAT